jgi:hypothetical protein
MFLNLKKINNIFNDSSINIEKIYATRIWIYKNNEDKLKKSISKNNLSLIKFFLRTLYISIFTHPLIIHPQSKIQSIFYIRKYSRHDLDKHSNYYENVENTTVCLFSKRIKKFNIYNFFLSIFFLIKFRKSFINILNKNNISLFSIISFDILIEFLSDLSDVIKIFPLLTKHQKVVSFQEMAPIENFICQIANIIGVKTFALQHAIYLFSQKGNFENRYSITSYLNTVCKNILCWGNFNKNTYKKYTNAKLFKVGKAWLPDKKNFLDGVTIIFEDRDSKISNEELFSISSKLSEHGVPVSSWFKKGHSLIKNIDGRQGPLRKIVIGTKSSLLFELGYLGYEVYFSKKTNLKKEIPKNLIIDDLDLFLKKYLNNKNYPHNIWKNFIECTDKESVNRYRKILLNQ